MFPQGGGEGVGAISGWVISNTQYRLADDPSKLSAVDFDLDKPVDVMKVSVKASNSIFFECKNNTGRHWICDVEPSISISYVTELRVVAIGD